MLSIIVPVYNEEASLSFFFKELAVELSKLQEKFEIIFIDDGSIDDSLVLLKKIERKWKNIRIFSFRKNRGKAEALTLGFQKAKGEAVVTLDADLQDKPSEIKKLLDKLNKEKPDAVSGWRKSRKDKSRMVIISKIFNYLAGILFGLNLHDYNCGLKVYSRNAAKSLRLYGGQHRFIPLLLHQQGFTVDEVAVEHQARKYGKSKYGFFKIFKDMPDMFTMMFLVKYGKRPLHFFGPIGGLLFLTGLSFFSYLVIIWLGGESIGRRPLLTFSVLLMIAGLQIFLTGFIGELIVKTAETEYHPPGLKYSTD